MPSKFPPILVDTREQTPWEFKGHQTIRTCLGKHGADYSLRGFRGQISIERKSLVDFVNSNAAQNRERFHASLKKLQRAKKHIIIVEGNSSRYRDIARAAGTPWRPEWIEQSAVFLMQRGYHVHLSHNAKCAEMAALFFLKASWKDITQGME